MLCKKIFLTAVVGGLICKFTQMITISTVKLPPCAHQTFQKEINLSFQEDTQKKSSFFGWQKNFSRTCCANGRISDKFNLPIEPPITRCDQFPGASHSDTSYTRSQLFAMQTCVFAALDRWTKLASDLNINNWSLQAGSLVGLICYEAMVPWDDDIDIVVFGHDCHKLEQFFDGLPPRSDHQNRLMIAKKLDADFTLHQLKSLFRYWNFWLSILKRQPVAWVNKFKIRSKIQPFMGDILGLDIDCKTMPAEGINNSKFDTVHFGPLQTRLLRLEDVSALGFTSITCLA